MASGASWTAIACRLVSSRAPAPHSSRGPGRRPLKAEITGSNPVCGTNPNEPVPGQTTPRAYTFASIQRSEVCLKCAIPLAIDSLGSRSCRSRSPLAARRSRVRRPHRHRYRRRRRRPSHPRSRLQRHRSVRARRRPAGKPPARWSSRAWAFDPPCCRTAPSWSSAMRPASPKGNPPKASAPRSTTPRRIVGPRSGRSTRSGRSQPSFHSQMAVACARRLQPAGPTVLEHEALFAVDRRLV